MYLFIHDTPIHVISSDRPKFPAGYHFDFLATDPQAIFTQTGKGWVDGFCVDQTVDLLVDYFQQGQPTPNLALTWVIPDISALKAGLKAHFEYLEAAGGLVRQQETFLLIHRLSRWDLPKGKIETGENPEKAARREVLEECGVNSRVGKKIGNTWHTYSFRGKPVLKKTHWYFLSSENQFSLTPQIEEDIAEVKWCTFNEAAHHLSTSYASIQQVWKKAQRQIKERDTVNKP